LPSQTYAVEIVSASVPRKRLQRKRSELVERSFAHVCETGGGRRTWLRGLVKVTKRYVVQVAAHNLVLLTRKLFGVGKPRVLQGAVGWLIGMVVWLYWLAILRAGRRYRAWGLIVAI
jgi:hypothetical protein